MKEIAAQPEKTHLNNRWEDATWYLATTLRERLAMFRGALSRQDSGQNEGGQKLQRWKNLPAFKDAEERFAARLAIDDLNEDELSALLAMSAEEIQRGFTEPPPWLQALREAFEDQDERAPHISALLQRLREGSHAGELLSPFQPLIKRAALRLQAQIERLAEMYAELPFDPETVLELLLTNTRAPLLTRLSKAVVLELHVARVQERLQGATPEERFHNFLQWLSGREETLNFLEEYVVLARQLVETLENWVASSTEFLERLCADWKQIRATFFPDDDPGTLTEIHQGAGDPHHGGRGVILLRWSSDARLVYKPRPLAMARRFQDLLAWMNGHGYEPGFRALQVLDKGSYGWIEFVKTRECSTKEEIERFYQRLGGYLALLYAVEAADFHAENIIAAGEHPVLIDIETLFLPRFTDSLPIQQEMPGLEAIGRSALRIGILPQRLWSNQENEGIDLSGMGGQDGQFLPRPIQTWKALGTDEMHITRERARLPTHSNRPKLRNEEVNALDYRENLLGGFIRAYRLLMERREELLTEIIPAFAEAEIRYVLRPTKIYGQLLEDSHHPNLLRDALEQDRLLDRLWMCHEQLPHFSPLIPGEQADLRQGDIPMFTTRPNTVDLFTSQGQRFEKFFDESGLEAVQARIQQLSEDDLEMQSWIIRASFTSLIQKTEKQQRPPLKPQPARKPATRERLLTAATAIGNRLEKFAIVRGSQICWLGLIPFKEREWHVLPVGLDLYDGMAGIALFLAYLGAFGGEQRFTRLARSVVETIQQQIERQQQNKEPKSIGFFSGLGSSIYLFSHLGALWNEPMLYREADKLVEVLAESIEADTQYDIIGGAAGGIAALLSLYAVAPAPGTLAAAVRCGEHLIAGASPMEQGIGWSMPQQEIPLAGFAHGNAGIALSLLRLFGVSGDERFRQTAVKALEYERTLYSPEKRNWRDLRDNPYATEQQKQQGDTFMVAWCHGAAGVGLARLEMLRYLDDPTLREELEIALNTTLTQGFGTNHSLCHGDMGNLDILLTATQRIHIPDTASIAATAASLLDTLEEQGQICGTPLGIETPGLMTGLAGIGYALLRLIDPERVPSILLQAAPTK